MTGPASLLGAVRAAVAERSPLADARVDRLTVGDRLALVEVAAGEGEEGDAGVTADDVAGGRAAGVAHRPPGALDVDPAGDPALDVAGWAVDGDAEDVGDGPLARAVGVATLNALSAPLMAWRSGDPFEALAGASTIATVGLFAPAFRKFGAVDVRVIERRDVEPPGTPAGVTTSLYGPDEAEAAFDGADVVFVTGSTLLYGGTEAYLAAAGEAGVPDVVLVGATVSFVPEPAFEAGATLLAGAQVTDVAGIRGRIAAGECATDLHDEGMAKVYVRSENAEESGLDFE